MNTDRLSRILNRAAECIEGACYVERLPVRIGFNDIVVLANQCRMYAHPLIGRKAIHEWQVEKLRREDLSTNDFGSAFRDISVLETKAYPTIKGELGLPAAADFGIKIGGGAVVFDFSLSDLAGEEYFHPLLLSELGESRKNQIVIGRTLESETVVVNMEDVNHHHILTVGSTGSGKTVLANTLIGGAAMAYSPEELWLFACSGKEEDVALWAGLPHLKWQPSYDVREVVAILSWAKKERERRSHLPARERGLLPHIVIYIGEISALLDKSGSVEMSNLLDDLLCLGRSSKIHLWVTTQRPTGKKVGGTDAKGQFKLIMCGSMQNPQDAYIALGMGGSGAEFLPNRGAFVTNSGTRFQAAYLGDDIDPSRINEIIAVTKGRWGEPEYIELDIAPAGSVESNTLTQDIVDLVAKLRENKDTEIAKTYITTIMGWGYSRANRVWMELERRGIILARESKNVPSKLDLEVMAKEFGGKNG